MQPRSTNYSNFLIIYIAHHLVSQRVWKLLIRKFNLSKHLLSDSLLCSDWSDGPVCCDWSTLLWLVKWPSLLWLIYFALIGQMAQSVVIGLLFSDWSDGPVCCDWSTLLWLVRWHWSTATTRVRNKTYYHIWISAALVAQ